jgi:hypothetical protein
MWCSRTYAMVSQIVALASRGAKPSSSRAFLPSKYQKYLAWSAAVGSMGGVRPMALNSAACARAAYHGQLPGSLRRAEYSLLSRSMRSKYSAKVRL